MMEISCSARNAIIQRLFIKPDKPLIKQSSRNENTNNNHIDEIIWTFSDRYSQIMIDEYRYPIGRYKNKLTVMCSHYLTPEGEVRLASFLIEMSEYASKEASCHFNLDPI